MTARNHSIDSLRFLASSFVVLFHLNEPINYIDNFYRNMAKLGWLGVPAFFVISGYCIGLAANHSKGFVDFFVRRFFRIYPCYWFSLLVVLGCVGFELVCLGQNSVTKLPRSIGEISATILLLIKPFSSVQAINWVYWSLTVEIFFYLAVGASLLIKRQYQNIFILIISLAAFIPHIEHIRGFFFLKYWAAFGIGFSLLQLKVRKNKILPLLVLCTNSSSILFQHLWDAYTITCLISFFIVAVSIYWYDLPGNPISALGDYAYSVYLLHVPIGAYLFGLLKTPAIQLNIFYNIVFDLCVLCILWVISAQVYKYVELPGIRFGKKLQDRMLVTS